ncbi:hypothetical protein Tco_0016053 [Tanacetum coccineum]
MDEGFTASAYPDVQENLKLTVDDQVIPEEPVSSTGTLSSLQHLAKDFSFGDQFLNDKPSEADNEKTTIRMVVIISKACNESSLRARFKDLSTSDMKEILVPRLLISQAGKLRKKSNKISPKYSAGSPPFTSPPPPPTVRQHLRASGQLEGSEFCSCSSFHLLHPHPTHQGDHTTTDTRVKPSSTMIPDDLYMDDETTGRWKYKSSSDDESAVPHTLYDQVDGCQSSSKSQQATSTGRCSRPCNNSTDFFFNKDLEYLRYDCKVGRPALSISKMKAAYYPNVGLEQLVPDQFWIEEECKYDIAAMYGISHWWFQRQRFYIVPGGVWILI